MGYLPQERVVRQLLQTPHWSRESGHRLHAHTLWHAESALHAACTPTVDPTSSSPLARSTGIESYCLYFVLSVADHFAATGDNATATILADNVAAKLEHAHDLWGTRAAIGFVGWDVSGMGACP